ncbi:MAG: YHS domain-containing protein [Candidatus Rokubacteria bacterium]|nr:YHS domain-containing protein [Candidatus Rokubacteria bacterium]
MSEVPEAEVVFVVADLAGYTALTEAHGSKQAASVVTRYVELAQEALEPGTRLVERAGDELLIVADDAARALRVAARLRDAVEREPLFPTVRVGIHAGRALEQDGRYFGTPLNVAARVAAHARGGQILCTEEVRRLAGEPDDVEYRPVGPVRFKNVTDPIVIVEVVAGRRAGEPTAVDPVCRMLVRPETAPARLPFAGRTYHFCSFECARAFAERPEAYAEA